MHDNSLRVHGNSLRVPDNWLRVHGNSLSVHDNSLSKTLSSMWFSLVTLMFILSWPGLVLFHGFMQCWRRSCDHSFDGNHGDTFFSFFSPNTVET